MRGAYVISGNGVVDPWGPSFDSMDRLSNTFAQLRQEKRQAYIDAQNEELRRMQMDKMGLDYQKELEAYNTDQGMKSAVAAEMAKGPQTVTNAYAAPATLDNPQASTLSTVSGSKYGADFNLGQQPASPLVQAYSDGRVASTTTQPNPLKAAIDYAKKIGDVQLATKIGDEAMAQSLKYAALTGSPSAAIEHFNAATGANLQYLGAKGDVEVIKLDNGMLAVVNKTALAQGVPYSKAIVPMNISGGNEQAFLAELGQLSNPTIQDAFTLGSKYGMNSDKVDKVAGVIEKSRKSSGKIIDKTIDLGDRTFVQYADGTSEYMAKAARPDTVLKIESGVASGNKPTKPKQLPAAQVSDLADFKAMVTNLNDAANIAKRVNTGPIAGRGQTIASKFGGTSKDFVDFRQKLSTVNNIMLKLRSGAAVTDQEYQRFLQEMPTVNDPENVRDAKLQNAIAYMTNLQNDKMQAYEETGYVVPKSTAIQKQPVAAKPVKSGRFVVQEVK